ncbi:hypothetical protein A9Q76_06410 [Arcobacter sp. 31_11_sub10_T18]|nr:hypothetical protein A9Q76_06410 [Arcobacter sp. 31_11_sub10_T18]
MIIQDASASHSLFETSTTQKKEKKESGLFDKVLGEQKSESQIAKEKTQQLMDDIRSVMRTGLTEQELEELEAKIAEIQKRIKEASEGEGGNIGQISSMMDEIEKLIAEAQKKVNGVVIKEVDKNTSLNSSEGTTSEMAALNTRVQDALSSINALRDNKNVESQTASTHDKVSLMEEFQNA